MSVDSVRPSGSVWVRNDQNNDIDDIEIGVSESTNVGKVKKLIGDYLIRLEVSKLPTTLHDHEGARLRPNQVIQGLPDIAGSYENPLLYKLAETKANTGKCIIFHSYFPCICCFVIVIQIHAHSVSVNNCYHHMFNLYSYIYLYFVDMIYGHIIILECFLEFIVLLCDIFCTLFQWILLFYLYDLICFSEICLFATQC